MGADIFTVYQEGEDVGTAFDDARVDAFHMYGHRGYTGSLAEKDSYTVIDWTPTSRLEAEAKADSLIHAGDRRIDNKWSPAGALAVRDDDGEAGWLFFGWASS